MSVESSKSFLLTADQISDLIQPKKRSATPPEDPKKQLAKKQKVKRGKRKNEPTKPFTYKLNRPIILHDLKDYQFIPREAELEEVVRSIKTPSVNKPADPNKEVNVKKEDKPTDLKSTISNNGINGENKLKPSGPISEVSGISSIKETRPKPDESVPGSRGYFKTLRDYNTYHQSRRSVQFIIPIGPKKPKILLLSNKAKPKEYVIPQGFLAHDEDEEAGLERIWNELFGPDAPKVEFPEVLATWYRPDYKLTVYPYDPKLSKLKEITKVYLVQLPQQGKLKFHGFYESLTPIDFYELYELSDPQVKNIPLFLSNFGFTTKSAV